jgi:hypothetical protein
MAASAAWHESLTSSTSRPASNALEITILSLIRTDDANDRHKVRQDGRGMAGIR